MANKVRPFFPLISTSGLRVSFTGLAIALVLTTAVFAVTVLWTRTVSGSSDSWDAGNNVALAPNGDLYAVGYKVVTGQGSNIWIRKYSPSGGTLWTRTKNGPASSWDSANDAAVDPDGNLYVVGNMTVTGQEGNIWIRKYDGAGTTLWTRVVNGPASTSDYGSGVAVRGSTSVYVVGNVSVPGQGSNIWIRKYNSAGSKTWTRIVDGPADGLDSAVDVAVDAAGNVYVIGYITTPTENENIWIRKYNSAGSKIWTRSIDGPAGGNDRGLGVAIAPDQNVYFVGYIDTSTESLNMWIRKYTPSGVKLWTRTANGAGDYVDHARNAVVGTNGALYVVGFVGFTIDSNRLWLRKYSSGGTKRWTTTYAGPEDQAKGSGVAINDANRIYVTGDVRIPGLGFDILVRKYRQ